MKPLIAVLGLLVSFVNASTTTPSESVYATTTPAVLVASTTFQKIDFYATKYGVDSITMNKVVKCESGYHSDAIGDQGNSFGLVQIHLPSNPSIRKEQALDPDFSLDFLASRLLERKGYLWTCYRILKLNT